ncbi:MAG: glycogen synthase [Bifidobacteriaceae bacterium]|jgi:starch synthase|nr:glycogen synthase [Bifidobacteriaceae bacterium]
MKIDIISREYPPFIYGGAGVHVDELSKALDIMPDIDVNIRCFDGKRDKAGVFGYEPHSDNLEGVFSTLDVDIQIANQIKETDIIHSHTWYANLAGFLASKNLKVPHIITAHSLEPLRPWKAEQLGGGYSISSFAEKISYEFSGGIIAVSNAMRNDILRFYPKVDPDKVFTVLNGIDIDKFKKLNDVEYKTISSQLINRYSIKSNMPTAVFVGRITRQKGLVYLMKALAKVPKDIQIILCAGAPDTPEIMAEVNQLYTNLQSTRGSVILIDDMLPLDELKCVLQMSDVFLCPSIYEPLGIVNLEAMALSLPVVATKTVGIPSVVQNNKTGVLIDIEQKNDGTGKPLYPDKFIDDLASEIIKIFSNMSKAKEFGQAGRVRVENYFTWDKIAEQTIRVYKAVLANNS